MSSRPPGGAGSGVCFGPREPDKPFADSERAQKWRLSLASLLFFTVLLSDHLWLCVEARQVAAGRHRHPRPGMEGTPGGGSSGSSGQCFSVLSDAEAACGRLQAPGQAELYLPFCNTYTLRELFAGLSRPDTLNCTLDRAVEDGGDHQDRGDQQDLEDCTGEGEGHHRRRRDEDWLRACRRCVRAYQSYDQQAQDRYREFELVLQKYLQAEEYSVKSGPEDCKILHCRAKDLDRTQFCHHCPSCESLFRKRERFHKAVFLSFALFFFGLIEKSRLFQNSTQCFVSLLCQDVKPTLQFLSSYTH